MARLAERSQDTAPDRAEGAIAARGMADAAALLARNWVLQLTNVPYLGRGKQDSDLKAHLERRFFEAKSDLATAMLVRMLRSSTAGGSISIVSPQNWLFLPSYLGLRQRLLNESSLNQIAILGEHGFESAQAAGAFVALSTITNAHPDAATEATGLDCNEAQTPSAKAALLQSTVFEAVKQEAQRNNPDQRIAVRPLESGNPFSQYAVTFQGIKSGDDARFRAKSWEVISTEWRRLQAAGDGSQLFDGCSDVIFWGHDGRHLTRRRDEGQEAARKYRGIAIAQMRDMPVSVLAAEAFDSNISPVFCLNEDHAAPILTFCESQDFKDLVRSYEPTLKTNNGTFTQVPFDLELWRASAADRYPNGLPEPYSDDPTQWLFHGHPGQAEIGTALHVALARLCGHRWPAEIDTEMRLSSEARAWIARAAELPSSDADGLLPLVACGGEAPLAERLRSYARVAFGDAWSADLETRLVAEADAKLGGTTKRSAVTIDDWLRTRAFAQHAKLFHHRPFLCMSGTAATTGSARSRIIIG